MTARNRLIIWISLAIAQVFCLGALLISIDTHTALSLYKPEEGDHYGSTDWVTWEDGPEGVTASRVHPLVKSSPVFSGNYVQPGDVLVAVDYRPVIKAETIQQSVYRAAPGTVFLYKIKRKDVFSFSPTEKNIFVEAATLPRFSFFQDTGKWSAIPWLIAPAFFLALLFILILFPVLRSEWKDNFFSFGVLITGLVLFGILLLRYITLIVLEDFSLSSFEKVSNALLFITMGVYGWFFLASHTRGMQRLATVFPGMILFWISYGLIRNISGNNFFHYAPLYETAFAAFFLSVVLFGFINSFVSGFRELSRADKIFHLVSILSVGVIAYFVFSEENISNENPRFALHFLFLLPLANATVSRLKFGKVSVVLSRSISYAIFAGVALLLFFIIHQSMEYLAIGFRYRAFLETGILVAVIMLIWAVYSASSSRLRRYFVLSGEKRKDEMKKFISGIPQVTSSKSLIQEVENKCKAYFGTDKAMIWLSGEEKNPGLSEDFLQSIYEKLSAAQENWSASKLLPSVELERIEEEELKRAGMNLVFPMRIRDNYRGLFLLGNRRRGVYNLDDIELLAQMTQQVRLTLGVLHLLEQEKLLVQKNLEANLTALRSQINPHFLFNTLNTISSLIHDAPDEAEKATEKLAFIFRYTLKQSSRNFVHLKEELSLITTYLEIEKMRFGKRMNVEIETEKDVEDVEIPAFVIQTLIENAVKHGIGKVLKDGIIRILSTKEGEFLQCIVEDNGPGIDLTRVTSSTGLNNILSRLENVYGKKNLLKFENTGNGTRVTLKIPLQYEHAQSPDR